MGWASWGLRAPWGLFNWQVAQEETTCLIVVWRPAPLKDLSSNLWRAFFPKWAMACKELIKFHWRFPGRKKSPSFWNHPIWFSWKLSLLALRVSLSVYEGVSGKLVCGTKVQFSSVQSLSCVWLFAIPCSMPGIPVHHQLLEFTQTHVHWVGDAIQPSHSL